jgi:hypothetical protein
MFGGVHNRLIKGLLYAASGFVVLVVLGWGFLAAAEATASPPMVLNPSVPLVKNGVAAVMACGKGDGFLQATDNALNSQRGTWSSEKQGDCTVWHHHPRDAD